MNPLEQEIFDALRPDLAEPEFDELALKLFRHQARHNDVYRGYLERKGIAAASVGDWREIPALPARAFKQYRVACFPEGQAARVFRTSGTTRGEAGETGRHEFKDLAHYERSAAGMFRGAVGADRELAWLLLVPPSAERPESSLSWMLDMLARTLAPGRTVWCVNREGRVDGAALRGAVERCRGEGQPVFLAGTSLGFADLLEREEPLPLPAGSLVMDTGGFKGRQRELNPFTYYKELAKLFGVEPRHLWNEYGMTELSSQAYACVEEGIHRYPPWVRARLLDPATGREAAAGRRGLIQWIDLANVGSVMALATLDTAIADSGGLRMQGRVVGADLRGCSLDYET
jgi:hypothetical protein